MAVPKKLTKINYDEAMKIIHKHITQGTGQWEIAPHVGDFVYKSGSKYKLIRPGFTIESWETGTVSM